MSLIMMFQITQKITYIVSVVQEELEKRGKAYTLFDDYDDKTIILIEKLIKKKIYKTTFDKIFSSQKISYNNFNPTKEKNKYKSKTLLPEENYSNFKESGKIPDFLN